MRISDWSSDVCSSDLNTRAKVSHRAWFSPKEYKQLYTATRNRMRKPPRPAFKWHAEQLHDYVPFMANTGLRPDEARNLQHRSEEHTSELQSLMRISYDVLCLKKNNCKQPTKPTTILRNYTH